MEIALLELDASARLQLNEGACLPLRSDFGRCRACADACPVDVLDVTVERVAMAPGCLHCGRCVAACPTEALRMEGFETGHLQPGPSEAVEVECAKVPADRCAPASVRVPCLGGLSAGRLAALHEAAGDRGVALVDRGWCAGCKAGGGAVHPAAGAVERVALWLTAVHDPRPVPRIVLRPLPAALMPEAIPALDAPTDEGPALSRRAFLRTLAADPVGVHRRGTPMGGPGRAAHPPSERRESPERRRLLDALDAAARRAGTEVPSEFFPRVHGSGACVDHRVCTAACPTGALKVVAVDGVATLTFAGAACIACGACGRACPEHALLVEDHGGTRAVEALAVHAQRFCSTCGEVFTPRSGESLCLACTKSNRFIGDAMSQLFGAKH